MEKEVAIHIHAFGTLRNGPVRVPRIQSKVARLPRTLIGARAPPTTQDITQVFQNALLNRPATHRARVGGANLYVVAKGGYFGDTAGKDQKIGRKDEPKTTRVL